MSLVMRSRSLRSAWIEISMGMRKSTPQESRSLRSAWIEIRSYLFAQQRPESRSLRSAWIEIGKDGIRREKAGVALLAERVD